MCTLDADLHLLTLYFDLGCLRQISEALSKLFISMSYAFFTHYVWGSHLFYNYFSRDNYVPYTLLRTEAMQWTNEIKIQLFTECVN